MLGILSATNADEVQGPKTREEEIRHRWTMPENKSPALGRPFFQGASLDPHPDRVVEGAQFDFRVVQITDYNKHALSAFSKSQGETINLSSSEIRIMGAYGTKFKGQKIQVTGVYEKVLGEGDDTALRYMADTFHSAINKKSFIAGDKKVGAPVGNGGANMMGRYGDRFTFAIKTELLNKIQRGDPIDLAFTMAVRTTGKLDETSASAILAGSTELFPEMAANFHLIAQGLVALNCDNLTARDLKATDISIKRCNIQGCGGLVLDPGEKGGLYFPTAACIQQLPLTYHDKNINQGPAKLITISVVDDFRCENNPVLKLTGLTGDCSVYATFGENLEKKTMTAADAYVEGGFSVKFNTPNLLFTDVGQKKAK
jgi:hypothetical protein